MSRKYLVQSVKSLLKIKQVKYYKQILLKVLEYIPCKFKLVSHPKQNSSV